MKTTIASTASVLLALGLSTAGIFAKPGDPPATETPAVTEPAKLGKGKVGKPHPFFAKIDTLDVQKGSFTHKTKDGRTITYTTDSTTEVKNGGTAAKIADLKVGDSVGGLAVTAKKDAAGKASEVRITKITKFGANLEKPKKGDKKKK